MSCGQVGRGRVRVSVRGAELGGKWGVLISLFILVVFLYLCVCLTGGHCHLCWHVAACVEHQWLPCGHRQHCLRCPLPPAADPVCVLLHHVRVGSQQCDHDWLLRWRGQGESAATPVTGRQVLLSHCSLQRVECNDFTEAQTHAVQPSKARLDHYLYS